MGPAQPAAGVVEAVSATLASARATIASFLELVTLEARRAGLALAWMLACAFGAALCVAAGWLGLMAALALWAVSRGLPPIAAVSVVALFNLAAAAALVRVCIGLSKSLGFEATRRQVSGAFPARPPAP